MINLLPSDLPKGIDSVQILKAKECPFLPNITESPEATERASTQWELVDANCPKMTQSQRYIISHILAISIKQPSVCETIEQQNSHKQMPKLKKRNTLEIGQLHQAARTN